MAATATALRQHCARVGRDYHAITKSAGGDVYVLGANQPPPSGAIARGVSRIQVALAWLLSKSVITAPIVGATKLYHLDDAIASVKVKLSSDEVALLEEPYVPHAVVGFA